LDIVGIFVLHNGRAHQDSLEKSMHRYFSNKGDNMFKTVQITNFGAKSVKTKLIVAACLILVLSVGVTGFFILNGSEMALAEKIAENMQGNAEIAAEGIAKEVAATRAIIKFIAMDDKIKTADPAVFGSRLAEIKQTQPKIETLFFVDQSGRFLASDGTTGSLADRDYFKEVLEKKATAISGDPVVSKATGKLVVVVITPVTGENSQIKGYTAAAINIDTIRSYVLNRKIGKTGYSYAFGKSGLIFIHPSEQVALKLNLLTSDKLSPALKEISLLALKGEQGAKEYEYEGITKFAGYAPVPGTSWGVSSTDSKAEAMAKVDDLQNHSVLIAIVALLFAAIFMYFIAANIINPVIRLVEAANLMADGDLTQTVKVTSDDEVGQLGTAFNAMVANLKSLIQQVQRNAEQVAASSQQLTANAQQSTEVSGHVADTMTEMAAGAVKQTDSVADTAAIIEEMSAAIEETAAISDNLAAVADKTTATTHGGRQTIERAVAQINSVGKDPKPRRRRLSHCRKVRPRLPRSLV